MHRLEAAELKSLVYTLNETLDVPLKNYMDNMQKFY